MARRWLGRLTGRTHTVLGNHDVLHNVRTPEQWAEVYGNPQPNFVIDLPFVRIICPAAQGDLPKTRAGTFSPAMLAWLEEQLKGAPPRRDCWVAFHWPLFKTVMGDSKKVFTSALSAFHAKPDDLIRALLARNPNAKAWISGHTHSPLEAPGLITRAELPERRTILSVNLSAIAGVGKSRDQRDPICSLYLTHLPGKIEIRFRDHGSRAWRTVHGKRVQTVRV